MKAPTGILKWDINKLANALKISTEDVKTYFTDGRRVSFILERRIAFEVINGTLASSEGAGFDLIDSDGDKWEVRSISRGGVYFCPSYMVGSGRHFEEIGFLTKLSEIRGYILADIQSFPDIPFWIIPAEQVEEWWQENKLGNTTKINRKVALHLVSESEWDYFSDK